MLLTSANERITSLEKDLKNARNALQNMEEEMDSLQKKTISLWRRRLRTKVPNMRLRCEVSKRT